MSSSCNGSQTHTYGDRRSEGQDSGEEARGVVVFPQTDPETGELVLPGPTRETVLHPFSPPATATRSSDWVKFVGIDPGYVNLAITVTEKHKQNNSIRILSVRHCNVGGGHTLTSAQIITRLLKALYSYTDWHGADEIRCEENDFGRTHTFPRNVGVAWLVSAECIRHARPGFKFAFVGSRRKWTVFSQSYYHLLPHPDINPWRRQLGLSDHQRRKRLKANSIALAKLLVRQEADTHPDCVFAPDRHYAHEHVADALCLNFIAMRDYH